MQRYDNFVKTERNEPFLRELDRAIAHLPESELRGYREGVRGL